MFAKVSSDAPSSSPSQRELQLARLRRNLIAGAVAYGALVVVTLLGSAALVLLQIVGWVKALPPGVDRSFDRLMQDAPQIFYLALVSSALGLLLATPGFVMLKKILAGEPPVAKRLLWTMCGGNVMFALMAAGTALSTSGFAAALVAPLFLGYSLAFVPMEVGLLAACMASLGLNQLRQRPTPIESSKLPTAAAKYLNSFDADALEAGLTPLGDFAYLPHWKKYRRYWMAPNGAYFVDASWIDMGHTTLSAMGVTSATSDGSYFETADQPRPQGVSDAGEGLAHITYLPGEPLAVILERHIEVVGEWVERSGCRPLEFAADELHALGDYGIAALMRETQNDFLWLGNPYAGQPLPPLPGRPWQPDEALASR